MQKIDYQWFETAVKISDVALIVVIIGRKIKNHKIIYTIINPD